MSVRAKMYVAEKTEYAANNGKVVLRAVARGDHNATWAAATPTGTMELNINNRPAFDALKIGAEYLVTFEEAAPPELADGHEFRLADVPDNHYLAGKCGECGMLQGDHEEPKRSELVAMSRGQ